MRVRPLPPLLRWLELRTIQFRRSVFKVQLQAENRLFKTGGSALEMLT